MAARNRQPEPEFDDDLPLPPPIDAAGRDALRQLPGVIVYRRDPAKIGWRSEPLLRVREGFDIGAALDRERIADSESRNERVMVAKRNAASDSSIPTFQALTPEERRELLRRMPGVIVHQREPDSGPWSFKPWVRVRDGVDVNAIIEREQDKDALDFLGR